jgi:FixJ family two-component response regulator
MSSSVAEESGTPLSPDAQGQSRIAAADSGGLNAAPFALIIDDREAFCKFVAKMLDKLGVESAAYPTAEAAIASLDERRPAVIFLDFALEDSDAMDVIKGLSEKHYTGMVQLMSSGRLPLLESVRCIGARHGLVVRPPLQKPVSAEAIRDVVVSAGLASDVPPAASHRPPHATDRAGSDGRSARSAS